MKRITLAVALALACTFAAAADSNTTQTGTTAGSPTDGSPKGNASGAYWSQHGKDGYMTKDHAMGYKSDRPMDFSKLDADGDGRVSQQEWNSYYGTEGTGKASETIRKGDPAQSATGK